MNATQTVSNTEDIMDSRDVIARIAYLEGAQDDTCLEYGIECEHGVTGTHITDEYEELQTLLKLQEQCEGYASDWQYGEALIRDSYFTEYAQDLADDIGAIDRNLSWPNSCIDWDRAARELQMDYASVDFDGVMYWIR